MKKRKKVSSNAYLKQALLKATANTFDELYADDEEQQLLEEIKLETQRYYAMTNFTELKLTELKNLITYLYASSLHESSKENISRMSAQFNTVVVGCLRTIQTREYVLHVDLTTLNDLDTKEDHFNKLSELVDGLKSVIRVATDYRKRLVDRYVSRLGLRNNSSLLYQSHSAIDTETLSFEPTPDKSHLR